MLTSYLYSARDNGTADVLDDDWKAFLQNESKLVQIKRFERVLGKFTPHHIVMQASNGHTVRVLSVRQRRTANEAARAL